MYINHLILILTTRCNLTCSYCYNKGQKEEVMRPEILKKTFRLIGGFPNNNDNPLLVQITGGEPTLFPELILLAAKEASLLPRPNSIWIQTNGTLLTPEIIRLLKDNDIKVGISLDGPPDINEKVRGKTVKLLEGLNLLEKFSLNFNVTTVVTSDNVKFIEKIPLILSGFSQVQGFGLDLLVKKETTKSLPADALDLRKAAVKLKQNLELVNKYRQNPLVLREQEFLLKAKEKGTAKNFCQACLGQSLAVKPNGEIVPCGQTADNHIFALGKLNNIIEPTHKLNTYSLSGNHCKNCFLENKCPGDCPSRLYFNKNYDPHLACVLYQSLAQQ